MWCDDAHKSLITKKSDSPVQSEGSRSTISNCPGYITFYTLVIEISTTQYYGTFCKLLNKVINNKCFINYQLNKFWGPGVCVSV